MPTRSHPTLRMLTLLMLMALVIRAPLQARSDRSPGTEGEMPVRYLVYVAAAGDGNQGHEIPGLSPLCEGMGDRARIVATIRLRPHWVQAGDDPTEPGRAGLAGPDLRRGVGEWLRRQAPAASESASGSARVNGLVLLVDGAGRVLGEASGSPWAARWAKEMPEAASSLSPRIPTDIDFSTWGKVKELFR